MRRRGRSRFINHRAEARVSAQQLSWRTDLRELASLHHHDFVTSHHSM